MRIEIIIIRIKKMSSFDKVVLWLLVWFATALGPRCVPARVEETSSSAQGRARELLLYGYAFVYLPVERIYAPMNE